MQNIFPKPSAERGNGIGKSAVGLMAPGAAVNENDNDVLGARQLGSRTRVAVMDATFMVVAGRTGDYIYLGCAGVVFGELQPQKYLNHRHPT